MAPQLRRLSAPGVDASGAGIVWAVVGSGIDGGHPHFRQHRNLELDEPLQHRDFTFTGADGESRLEALVDRHGSGTHDAGIIGGELSATAGLTLRLRRLALDADGTAGADDVLLPAVSGVAPQVTLVSLRVVDERGAGRLSHVLSALRWVREINAGAGRLLIHGVNIGLAYAYDYGLFACGATPLCVEVNALVASGVVVVAAAGNGLHPERGYAGPMTITDPGNAEKAITVGATHGEWPHLYGVSYFSSKGPTLDGRPKPDLVAPGERCASSVPTPRAGSVAGWAAYEERTGTSGAAAHTSGVVAALLSARRDLIGEPARVKDLLLASAEDLQRERYVQGRGMVSLARALLGAGAAALTEARPHPDAGVAGPTPSAVSPPPSTMPAAPPSAAAASGRRFSVALSYAGEKLAFVKQVVYALRHADLSRDEIFFDKYYDAELLAADLDTQLIEFYGQQSTLVAAFVSREYADKDWTAVEWRVIKDLIKRRQGFRVMVLRFDDTPLPGWLSIDVFLDLRNRDPEEVADKILDRLAQVRQLDARR